MMNAFFNLQKLWLQQFELATQAPLVIQERLWRFSQPVWSADTFAEFQRMYWEKIQASQGMALVWWKFFSSPKYQRQPMLARAPQYYQSWLNDSVSAANRSLYPFTRRVRANRRRLIK